MGSMLISMIFPVFDFSYFFSKLIFETNSYISLMSNITIYPGSIETVVENQLNHLQYGDILIKAHFIGVGILLIRIVWQLVQLVFLIRNSEITKSGKVNVIFSNCKNSPFSVFNFIVINKSDRTGKDTKNIFAHELIHIR